jgi:Mn-dependent DtxR family transcriptional regulator
VTKEKKRACGIEKGLSTGSLAAVPDVVGDTGTDPSGHRKMKKMYEKEKRQPS